MKDQLANWLLVNWPELRGNVSCFGVGGTPVGN
jgi:hypothetical protein